MKSIEYRSRRAAAPEARARRIQAGPGCFVRLAVGTLLFSALACTDSGVTPPENLRFGQEGEIRVQISKPLAGNSGLQGELQQSLTWNSNGPWQLFESISYRGRVGDETVEAGFGDPGAYAALIIQLNETPGLELFTNEVDPTLDPVCPGADARVTFSIRDNLRNEEQRWVRCSPEALDALTEAGSGPDVGAARVVTAARRTRDQTVGNEFRSAYLGSIPFGTLLRGEESPVEINDPRVFMGAPTLDDDVIPPTDWLDFWTSITGSSAPPPEVNWDEEMVLVGAVGLRQEAGDSVEIRRILQVESGTIVFLFERVPGNFCSPAARVHTPYHVVLAPKTRPLHRFEEPQVERVPCGG